jgi:hypothetical protein
MEPEHCTEVGFTCFSSDGSYLKLDGQVVMWEHNLPLLVEIGSTDLPKPEWAVARAAHPSSTFLIENSPDRQLVIRTSVYVLVIKLLRIFFGAFIGFLYNVVNNIHT